MPRFLALRQHCELLRHTAVKSAAKTWRLRLRREHLCADVLAAFGDITQKTRYKLLQPTCVIFVDMWGNEEEGQDEGGLTAELYSSFFEHIFRPERGLFEAADEGGKYLPKADAHTASLAACGRVLLKCVLDDHPQGHGLSRFVLEYLADAHETRVLHGPIEAALISLADYDPSLAERWSGLLRVGAENEAAYAGLTVGDFDADLSHADDDLCTDNAPSAIVAGCRRRLLTDRMQALSALREGFVQNYDISLQLGCLSSDELVLMLQGKSSISVRELLDAIEWPDPEDEDGFGDSLAPFFLRELLLDEAAFGEAHRLALLQWCTALSAMPPGGLTDRIKLRPYRDVDLQTLPETHTCSRELHLPSYESLVQLQERLLLALEHRQDGFQNM